MLCTVAFGSDALARVPNGLIGRLVDIAGLMTRPGQHRNLYWSKDTVVTARMELTHSDQPPVFTYEASVETVDFATHAYAAACNLGDFVALVVRPYSVEAKTTSDKGEPYLVIHGRDMSGQHIGPLRLWSHQEGDVKEYSTYIIRGLKVVIETVWSADLNKYVPRGDKAKTVECTFRTAVEDVSHVGPITTWFS